MIFRSESAPAQGAALLRLDAFQDLFCPSVQTEVDHILYDSRIFLNIKFFQGFSDDGKIMEQIETKPLINPRPELFRFLALSLIFEAIEQRIVCSLLQIFLDIVSCVDQINPLA